MLNSQMGSEIDRVWDAFASGAIESKWLFKEDELAKIVNVVDQISGNAQGLWGNLNITPKASANRLQCQFPYLYAVL